MPLILKDFWEECFIKGISAMAEGLDRSTLNGPGLLTNSVSAYEQSVVLVFAVYRMEKEERKR